MYECFLNESCVDGSCPKIAEEKIYGTRSSCDKYCGKGFTSCNACWFMGSEICLECKHYKDVEEKSEE